MALAPDDTSGQTRASLSDTNAPLMMPALLLQRAFGRHQKHLHTTSTVV